MMSGKSHGYYEGIADRYRTVEYTSHNRLLSKRNVITAWICNGGILPADIRCDVWDEALERVLEEERVEAQGKAAVWEIVKQKREFGMAWQTGSDR